MCLRHPDPAVSPATQEHVMPNSLTDVAAPAVVLTVGAALTLASVCSRSGEQLAAGVVLLIVALLGPHATRLSIRAAPAELTLERQLPRRRCPPT